MTVSTTLQNGDAKGLDSQLRSLQTEFNTLVEQYLNKTPTSGTDEDQGRREKIAEVTQKILSTVKDPADQSVDMTMQCALFVARRLFSEWGAWDHIPLGSHATITYADLASRLDAEESLVRRIGGVLVSQGVLTQVGADEIAHTPRSLIFTKGQSAGLGCHLCWEMSLTPYMSMPRYFDEYGRKEPQTINHVPATFAYGHPEMSVYEMIGRNPTWTKRFSRQMEAMEINMPIAGVYDFEWLVQRVQGEAPEDKDRPVFVDVGGSIGQAVKAIMAENLALPRGRFVLQDRKEVISSPQVVNDPELGDVTKIAVDFHREQPTKGSYVYFIRRCCHNYPDRVVSNMLRVIAESMAEDSRVLIQEDVMDNPPQPLAATLDVLMLGLGGKQRTLDCWIQVAAAAGLEVSGVSRGKGRWTSLGVVECIKKKAPVVVE